jgi:hypothetical protein
MQLTLCLNCLQADNVSDVEVGPEKGSQRDAFRNTISLCEICESALLNGDFATLADRQADERMIKRGTL